MKDISSRFCDYPKDYEKLMAFWLDCRVAFDVRLYTTIWRTRLLLTSRVWEQENDTQIWEDSAGHIIGFAILWRRQPTSTYIVLDCFVPPLFATGELLQEILKWGDKRAQIIALEQNIPLTIYASGFSQHNFSAGLMEYYGYSPIPPNPDEYNVYFAKSLQNELLPPPLPAGYKIIQIQNIDEIASYQAIYGFSKVHSLHRKEMIESDEYCHFVVSNPTGEKVAYCECSICYAEWERTNQRNGWIDYVETSPGYQNKGLGRAILMAGLEQLQDWGADTALLVTVSTNILAINLYQKTGFFRIKIIEYPNYQKQLFLPDSKLF